MVGRMYSTTLVPGGWLSRRVGCQCRRGIITGQDRQTGQPPSAISANACPGTRSLREEEFAKGL